ncbi:hypothetical protein BC826DRAFT_1143153 [Russula brevipes]|nr:hypothetical protein BC826DRAFT_1143153 [Russula brevipes]
MVGCGISNRNPSTKTMPYTVNVMSQTATSTPSSFQPVFDAALQDYKKKTGINLHSYPLCARLESLQSPDSVLTALREQIPGFDRPRSGVDNRASNWLEPTVNVLSAYSAMIYDRGQLAYPPATVIFTGIGVLLSVTSASQSPPFEVFELIGNFFGRHEIYIQVPATIGMMDVIVDIVIEMLSILAIATREIKRGRIKKYMKRLTGRWDIKDAERRLDRLTQEQAMMAPSQYLKGIQAVQYKTVEDKVAGIGDVVQAIAKDDAERAAAFNDNRKRRS